MCLGCLLLLLRAWCRRQCWCGCCWQVLTAARWAAVLATGLSGAGPASQMLRGLQEAAGPAQARATAGRMVKGCLCELSKLHDTMLHVFQKHSQQLFRCLCCCCLPRWAHPAIHTGSSLQHPACPLLSPVLLQVLRVWPCWVSCCMVHPSFLLHRTAARPETCVCIDSSAQLWQLQMPGQARACWWPAYLLLLLECPDERMQTSYGPLRCLASPLRASTKHVDCCAAAIEPTEIVGGP